MTTQTDLAMAIAALRPGATEWALRGDTLDTLDWFDPQPVITQEEIDAWLSKPRVPASVTPYQARIALLGAGLLDQVNTLMADPNTPQAAKIAWEYATTWERSSAFIGQLGPLLNLTDAQIDDLFVAAAAVQ